MDVVEPSNLELSSSFYLLISMDKLIVLMYVCVICKIKLEHDLHLKPMVVWYCQGRAIVWEGRV